MKLKRMGEEFLTWLCKAGEVISRNVKGESFSINCKGCTICCERHLNVIVSKEEVNENHKEWDVEFYEVDQTRGLLRIRKNDKGVCVHLLDGRCQIYDNRPRTCRIFDCRQRLIANVFDKHTRDMVIQWDANEWLKPENRIYIEAVRQAARQYTQSCPDTGVAETTQYAILNWYKYLGMVRKQIKDLDRQQHFKSKQKVSNKRGARRAQGP